MTNDSIRYTPGRSWKQRLKRYTRNLLLVLLAVLLIVWWQVLRIVEHDHWPPPADAVTAEQALQVTTDFVSADRKRDEVAIDLAPTYASDADFFLDGTQFFPEILADIESAQSSIHILMFAFAPGEWGDRIADALIRKASEGVEVRLITDEQGSHPFERNSDLYDRMAAGGVQIVVNDTWPLQYSGELPDRDLEWSIDEAGRSDHRKMLVIDGTIGWVGGAGFEDHFAGGEWLDTFTRIQGDVVRQLQLIFLTSYHAYGGTLPDDLAGYFPIPEDGGDIRVTVLQNIPGGFLPGTQASREAIQNATKRLDVLNPYFTDAGFIDLVTDAGERGVEVRVVTSMNSNNTPAAWAIRHKYGQMFEAGIGVYEVPGVLHAKVTVADDTVIIGSINYDAWSLYRNLELALMFEDADIADQVSAQIVDPVMARAEVPEDISGWREEIPAQFWWWLRYFL
ncbi:MAG: phosphatidylserine/phosphatidylglycerophosphate/cardiolipin synthase family protein [Thermomicrobiales bacterium]|nr:phosphatidylserine/phosphatidylglycerophosphate/cardiolipin synthase family protein [Thermomicrobiales bacterium]